MTVTEAAGHHVRVEHAFLDDGVYSIAAGAADARRAVLIMSPLGNECVKARRVLWRTLRALAEAGHGAVLIDPRGSGESSLEFEQTTLETLTADLELGREALTGRFADAEVSMLAFRYSAIPVAVAAARGEATEAMLVDPCLDPAVALKSDLRLEIVRQVRRHGKASEDRAQLLARLEGGDAIVVDGQRWSSELYRGLVEADARGAVASAPERCRIVKSGAQTFSPFYGHVPGIQADRNPDFESNVLEWLQ